MVHILSRGGLVAGHRAEIKLPYPPPRLMPGRSWGGPFQGVSLLGRYLPTLDATPPTFKSQPGIRTPVLLLLPWRWLAAGDTTAFSVYEAPESPC
jgi:hypothetical protein